MQEARGFTLIELMITIAIVGILAAVAYPAYTSYVQKGIRSEGQQFLMDVAQREEQYFLDNRAYASLLGTGAGGLGMTVPTNVSAAYTGPTITLTAGPPATYTISLAPIAGGSMANDGFLVINNLQQRWREVDGNLIYGANDCLWDATTCTPH